MIGTDKKWKKTSFTSHEEMNEVIDELKFKKIKTILMKEDKNKYVVYAGSDDQQLLDNFFSRFKKEESISDEIEENVTRDIKALFHQFIENKNTEYDNVCKKILLLELKRLVNSNKVIRLTLRDGTKVFVRKIGNIVHNKDGQECIQTFGSKHSNLIVWNDVSLNDIDDIAVNKPSNNVN